MVLLSVLGKSSQNLYRIKQTNKELAKDLDYNGIKFPLDKEDFSKIETKNNICINVYCYEKSWFFQYTFQIKNLKTQWICCL